MRPASEDGVNWQGVALNAHGPIFVLGTLQFDTDFVRFTAWPRTRWFAGWLTHLDWKVASLASVQYKGSRLPRAITVTVTRDSAERRVFKVFTEWDDRGQLAQTLEALEAIVQAGRSR